MRRSLDFDHLLHEEAPFRFLWLDFPVMLAAALVVTVNVFLRRPLGQMAGTAMVTAYVAYIAALFITT